MPKTYITGTCTRCGRVFTDEEESADWNFTTARIIPHSKNPGEADLKLYVLCGYCERSLKSWWDYGQEMRKPQLNNTTLQITIDPEATQKGEER